MANIILKATDSSLNIETKILSLSDGDSTRIGRCHERESVSCKNGLLPRTIHAISYHHARILFSTGKFYVRDTSRNGTYLNGYRLLKNVDHLLSSGDVIQLSAESFSSIGSGCFPSFYVKLFQPDNKEFYYWSKIQSQYSDPINLQMNYPNVECGLELLHENVRQRFLAMQVLDSIGDISINKTNQLKYFLETLKKENLTKILKLIVGVSESFEEEMDLQEFDNISHYMIGISCCKNFVVRKWFTDQEIKLLQIRWHFLHILDKNKLIMNYFNDKKLSEDALCRLSTASNNFMDLTVDYYKIPFPRVSTLVRKQEVVLHNGIVFVNAENLIVALVTDFEKTMKTKLKVMQNNLHRIWQDERITSIIQYIMKEVKFERYLFDNRTGSSVMLSQLDKLAEVSFPLCMSDLHYNLKRQKHLKNGGRLQYGLFLKGIGLSLQDSITFWRYYFTKKMPLDEFLKKYQYHILHSYGVVGKKADYPPQSCKKIMEVVPSLGEYHGCPYKILRDDDIIPLLKRNGIDTPGINKIIETKKLGMANQCCKLYFDMKHKTLTRDAPYHPNQYFITSQALISSTEKHLTSHKTNPDAEEKAMQTCFCKTKELDW